jgi:hypothetical protein
VFLPQSQRPTLTVIQYTAKIRVLYILMFSFFYMRWEDKRSWVITYRCHNYN